MRRVLGAAAVAVVCLVGCQPTEPAMTITARAEPTKPICQSGGWIRGVVTPADATTRVVLQRTVDGKWVDWKWYETGTPSEQRHLIDDQPDSQGRYEVPYRVPMSTATLHLRMRSNVGGKFSNGVYVTPKGSPGIPCPGG